MSVGRGLGGKRESRNVSRYKTASGVVLCRPWFIPVTLENGEATERDDTDVMHFAPFLEKHHFKRIVGAPPPPDPPPHTQ